jgi:hypothetical protein
MIKIQKQQNNPITVVRAASGNELSNYEKKKLASIEENAQQNKIEAIKIDGKRAQIDAETKTANINLGLGNLAFRNVAPHKLDTEDLIFIKCEL